MPKEIDVEAALANCRALINQINAGLSAEEPLAEDLLPSSEHESFVHSITSSARASSIGGTSSPCAYYGVSPYMAFSRPWAKASAGGISNLPPMISIYAPVLLARAAFIASSSSPSVVTRAVNQSAQPSAFGNSTYFQGARSL
jgi:hypothetical protein